MKTNLLRGQAAVVALMCAAVACDSGGDRDQASQETVVNGVPVVTNSTNGAWTTGMAWRAVEDLRLGTDEGDEPYVLAAPGALEADAAGRLYVLDTQVSQVRVFDSTGRHLRTFGHAGAGPGEMTQPAGLVLSPTAEVWVLDAGNARFVIFDSVGKAIGTRRRESTALTFPWPGRLDHAGRLWDVEQMPSRPPILMRTDPQGGGTRRFALEAPPVAQFISRRGGVANFAQIPYTPSLAWAVDPEGRVWSGVSDHYELALHEPGGDTLRVVRREQEPIPVTAAERDSIPTMLAWFTSQGGRVDLSRVPKHKPAFTSVMVDDRGWLWVRPSLPAGQENAAWDIFDTGGRLQGRLTLPVPIPEGMPVIVRGSNLYTVTLADAGYPQVVRFRLEGRR